MMANQLGMFDTPNCYPSGIVLQHLAGDLINKNDRYDTRMDIYAIRLLNFRAAVQIFGSRKQLSEAVNLSPNLLNQYIGKNPTKRLGDDVARRLDRALDMPDGWSDTLRQADQMTQIDAQNTDPVVLDTAQNISFDFCQIKGHLRMTNPDKMLINIVKIEQPTHKILVINATPNTICYQMRGSDLQPAIFDSWIVAIDPTLTPKSGELMLATLKNDHAIIGIYLYERADSITVQNLKTGALSTIDRADIVQIMPVTGIAMPSQMQAI